MVVEYEPSRDYWGKETVYNFLVVIYIFTFSSVLLELYIYTLHLLKTKQNWTRITFEWNQSILKPCNCFWMLTGFLRILWCLSKSNWNSINRDCTLLLSVNRIVHNFQLLFAHLQGISCCYSKPRFKEGKLCGTESQIPPN